MKSAKIAPLVKEEAGNRVRDALPDMRTILIWRVNDPVFASKHEVAGVVGQQITSQIYLSGR